jgi:mRNA interferase MazF
MSTKRVRSRSSWSSFVVRGDVHAIVLPRRRDHLQRGPRFAVVVQSNDLRALSTVVVCPTSQSTPAASFHPEIEVDGAATRVMCEMVGAVDVGSLGRHVAHLSRDEIRAVDDALELVLDLA